MSGPATHIAASVQAGSPGVEAEHRGAPPTPPDGGSRPGGDADADGPALGAISVPVRGGAPLTADARLGLPHGSRLHHCSVRGRWTLLVPERVLFPCPITTEVLQALPGGTLGEIAADMAERYDAPSGVVLRDIADLLSDLVEHGHVRRLDA